MALRDLLAMRRQPRTAFVLGGGGNLGAVQVGMLRALLERSIRPDLLVGCSVGALNAAAIAGDPTLRGATRLRDLWLGIDGSDVFGQAKLRAAWALARRGDGVYSNAALRRLIETWLEFGRLEDARVPLHVVATSLRTGLERWFDSGPAVEALLASSALPAVFPPVWIGGEPLVDGGVVDNVPIGRALRLGAKRIFVLHVGNVDRAAAAPRRPIDVLLRSFAIARQHRFRLEASAVPDGVEVVFLPGLDAGSVRMRDFSRSGELVRAAYESCAAFLDMRAAAGRRGAAVDTASPSR